MSGKRLRPPKTVRVAIEETEVKVEKSASKRSKAGVVVEAQVVAVKKVTKVTKVTRKRQDSETWRITTGGERVPTANGVLRMNPSLTTVPFLPVHEQEGNFAKIMSWNVNGIRAVLGKSSIQRWIAEENPLVVCLQETKTNSKKRDGVPDLDVTAPGYTTYWAHAKKPGYAGVATLTKVPPLSVRVGMGCEQHDAEGRVLTLEFARFYLVNTYAPNAGGGLKRLPNRRDFNRRFLDFVSDLGRRKLVVVAGDLNVAPEPVDLYNPKAHEFSACFSKEEREDFRELLRGARLIDTWRELNPVANPGESMGGDGTYTFWSFRHNLRGTNRGWRLDHMLVSAEMRPLVHKAFIRRELLGSDHTAIGLLLDKSLVYTI